MNEAIDALGPTVLIFCSKCSTVSKKHYCIKGDVQLKYDSCLQCISNYTDHGKLRKYPEKNGNDFIIADKSIFPCTLLLKCLGH